MTQAPVVPWRYSTTVVDGSSVVHVTCAWRLTGRVLTWVITGGVRSVISRK